MNKRSRKTKGLSHRLIALLLCCVCLLAAMPAGAVAADAAPSVEESVAEQQVSSVQEAQESAAPDASEVSAEPAQESDSEPSSKSDENGLNGNAVATFADKEQSYTATIEQGGTKEVKVASISGNDFGFECTQTGITASLNSSWGTYTGYTITVGASVPAGEYKLTVNYKTTSWLGGTTTYKVTWTIIVTRSGNYLTIINKMTNADVVYYRIENDVITQENVAVTSGTSMEVTLSSASDAIVFFVKPKAGYLLTQFYRKEGGVVDLYSVDTPAASCNFRYFADNPTTGDAILKKAKDAGYLGYYGFTGPSGSGYTGTFVEVAEAPQMTISAAASPNKDLKPGDKVTFTITVTPGGLSTGQNYTVTNQEITSLTINGVSYEATKNTDGTYSVDYEITEADWIAKKATLNATASLTYNYVVPVKDRNNVSGNIRTTETITSSATTDCEFATKKGVLYQLSYEAPEGINPPLDTSLADYIPAAPVDNAEYFEGKQVSVKDYDRSEVDDPANKGTWTFTGWTNGENTNLKAGDKVTMVGGGLLFTGVWKFTPYPNADLTIKKTLSGNMYNENDKFEFTVTYDGETEKFELGNGDTKTISIPVGAAVTVTEDAGSYTYSLTSISLDASDYTKLDNGVSFTMPRDAVSVEINNAKNITIDTGVILDKLPYILILAIVVIGIVALTKRRRSRADD